MNFDLLSEFGCVHNQLIETLERRQRTGGLG